MEDGYHRSYHGLPTQNFASRSLSSITEPSGPRPLNTTSSMHYQASLSMADPMAIWQHTPTPQSSAAAMSMMPNQHSNAAALMMLQSQGLPYYPSLPNRYSPTMQQQSQNAQFYHASLASSKRFSEEEKQKLEKVFTDETQKPSTSRKRQLAEELGCPVPKVNNWFQNRRAREKQMHRVQAYEASQAADRAVSAQDSLDALGDDEGGEDDDDNEDAGNSEVESLGSHNRVRQASSNPISDTDQSSEGQGRPTLYSPDGRGNDSLTGSPATNTLEEVNTSADEHHQARRMLESKLQRSSQQQLPQLNVSLDDTFRFSNHQAILSPSPEAFEDPQDEHSFQTMKDQLSTRYSTLGNMSSLGVFVSDDRQADYFPASASYMTQRTPTITTSIAEHDEEMDLHHSGQHDEASSYSSYNSLSPDMIPQASPNMHQTDLARSKESSQSSIASRRNTRAPQRLNQTALRDFQNGPKTGIEDTKRSDMYRTMRRAASANGPLSGKIFKSAPPLSPRSPRAFGPNFLEQLTHHSSLSATAGQFKDSSSASPIIGTFEQRYLSAGNHGLGLQHRSSSLSLNSYAEKMSLSPGTSEYHHDASISRGHNLGVLLFQNPKFAHDTGCGNVSPDESLTTPSLSQFGSELDFSTPLSAPRYVESEPTTPSYVPVTTGPCSAAHPNGLPTLKIETQPHVNIFPWSRSPDQYSMWNGTPVSQFGETQSQTFQFQPNVTPSNFQSPTGA